MLYFKNYLCLAIIFRLYNESFRVHSAPRPTTTTPTQGTDEPSARTGIAVPMPTLRTTPQTHRRPATQQINAQINPQRTSTQPHNFQILQHSAQLP